MDGDTTVTTVEEMQPEHGPPRDTVLIGKYRVDATLGFGGMGVVIKAHNLALDEAVAIKLLRDDVQIDDENIARFVREAKNAVKLKSEHVARIRDVGRLDDGRPYMVMELLEGADLGKLVLQEGHLERSRAVDLVLQACDAIAEAHSHAIVHRDIKPTNLFVAKRRDGSDLLKVLDFGISKQSVGPDMSLTQTSSMLGTPAYMSPEQMRSARQVDPRSDIWSLGTVLYELVEGRLPFDADNFAELCVMVAMEPPSPLTRAPELTNVIARCLEKQTEQRYQTVAELALALVPFASDPQRAQRQVARIERVLANAPRNAVSAAMPALDRRDPTPQVASRGSAPLLPMPLTPSPTSPMPLAATPSPAVIRPATPAPTPRRSATVVTITVLVVLFAVGIGAGIWAMAGGDDAPPARDEIASGASTPGTPVTMQPGSPTTPSATTPGVTTMPDATPTATTATPGATTTPTATTPPGATPTATTPPGATTTMTATTKPSTAKTVTSTATTATSTVTSPTTKPSITSATTKTSTTTTATKPSTTTATTKPLTTTATTKPSTTSATTKPSTTTTTTTTTTTATVRKPTVRKPPRQTTTSPPPPPKTCDPFDNPNGCR